MILQNIQVVSPFPHIKEDSTTIGKLEETYEIAEEIIENLDDFAIAELLGGSSGDLNDLYDSIVLEIYRVLYGDKGTVKHSNLQYLKSFTSCVEETLRVTNLNYFITSVLPNFSMNWHHYEWGNLVMKYKKLCIEAARDHGKCIGINQPILMYNGAVKKAKQIKIGDRLMGANSKVRVVKDVNRSRGDLYEISQYRGDNYIVNSNHILTLLKKKYTYNKKRNTNGYNLEIVDIDLKEYLKLSEYQRKTMYYGFKVCVEFTKKKVLIDPYFLGLWLGDGNKEKCSVTNTDKEVIEFLYSYAKELGLNVTRYTYLFSLINPTRKSNVLMNYMRKYSLLHNKHIPKVYLKNNKETRLQILAGLIDSDGNLHDGCYYIGQKSKRISLDIKRLADSLGFCTKFYSSTKTYNWMKREDKQYVSWEVVISGPLHIIPVKIPRKKVEFFDKQNHKHIGIIDGYDITVKSPIKVKKINKGDYISITIDKDKRFLLGDNTVTHNSFFMSHAVPIWKMYGYKSAEFLERNKIESAMRERGFIITNEQDLGKELLEIIKGTIEDNPILRERLYPANGNGFSETKIKCKNGTRLATKTYGGSFRGRHPTYIIVDDLLKDNVLYSEMQRKKAIDYFHSVVMNAIVPNGQVIVVGCVNENTYVPVIGMGLVRMKDLYPFVDKKEQKIFDLEIDISSKCGIDTTSKFWNNGYTKTKKITLQFGYNLECSLKHPVWSMSNSGIPDWVKSPDLSIGDYVAIKKGTRVFGNKISLIEFKNRDRKIVQTYNKLELPDYLSEDLAYLIGLYVSKGNCDKDGSFAISATEEGITSFLLSNPFGLKIRHQKSNDAYRFSSIIFRELLEYIKCPSKTARYKDVPEMFLQSDFETQRAFLQGLYDGDGCCYLHKSNSTLQVTLGSINPSMIDNVQIMLLNIGILSRKNTIKKAGTTTHIHGQLVNNNFDLHHLECGGYNGLEFLRLIGFRLQRKHELIEAEKLFKNVEFKQVVPHQYELLKRIRSTTKHPQTSKYNCSLAGQKTTDKEKLKNILHIMKDRGCSGESLEQFEQNIVDDFIWLPIQKIEDSESYTMDFVIPKTNSFISNGIVSHNTPFHSNDLYGDLKKSMKRSLKSDSPETRRKGWRVFEYPSLYPDGRVLWPERYTYNDLMLKREDQGNIIFSREHLVRPIISDSSIFSWSILQNAIVGMESYTLVRNRESFPIKFNQIVTGCDFAMSASVGADYTVFMTFGVDEMKKMWLLNMWREKGKTFLEQVAALKSLNANFRPDVIYVEVNQFQRIFYEQAQNDGLPVYPHTTGINKFNLETGLPSVALFFERQAIKFPRGDSDSRNKTDLILSELSSVTWTDRGKLEGVGENDDTAMSLWLCTLAKNHINRGFGVGFLDD